MSWDLTAAVGLLDSGGFCPNHVTDQQKVADMLLRISLIHGGMETGTGPVIDLPPFVEEYISPELIGAIQTFQFVQSAVLNQDSRVEPNGPTHGLMSVMANPPPLPFTTPPMLTLDPFMPALIESKPAAVSGLPAITFVSPGGVESLVYDDGSIRVTLSLRGVLTGSWGDSFGLACTVDPSLNALRNAIQSGSARTMGAAGLDQACTELRAQTRVAAHELFSAVQVSSGGPGVFKLGGSVGDGWRQLSVGYEFPNTVVATGSLTFNSRAVALPTLGGSVRFSGTLQCVLKCAINGNASLDQASIMAHLAVAGVVLTPVVAWIAESATLGGAIAIVGRPAGLASEWVWLGFSPAFAFPP